MKSSPYKYQNRLFRYDFDRCVVEYIVKATAEELTDEAEWKEKHGRPLLDIGEDGYMVLDTVGLSKENWKKKAIRDEYLCCYAADLEAEGNALAADFEKYELPYLMRGK